MERRESQNETTDISIVEAMDALQFAKEQLRFEDNEPVARPQSEVYSFDSIVYGQKEATALLQNLSLGTPGYANKPGTVEVVEKLRRESSLFFQNIFPRFFEQNNTNDVFKNTVPSRLRPIAATADYDFLSGPGLDELTQLSDILEGEVTASSFEDQELLLTDEDFTDFTAEIIAQLQPTEILNLFKRIHRLFGDADDPQVIKQLFEMLRSSGVMDPSYTNPETRRRWFLKHQSGSRQLLQAARIWTNHFDSYKESLVGDLRDSHAFTRIDLWQSGERKIMYTYSHRPIARYALDNPDIHLHIAGEGQMFYEGGQATRPKPGKRYVLQANRLTTNVKGVALSPHTPDSLAAVIHRPGRKITVYANTLLTAMSIINARPSLLDDPTLALANLSYAERLFALSCSPDLRQRILNHDLD